MEGSVEESSALFPEKAKEAAPPQRWLQLRQEAFNAGLLFSHVPLPTLPRGDSPDKCDKNQVLDLLQPARLVFQEIRRI